jgi:hypothetical protein
LVALGRICEAQGATAAAVPLWETLALGALPLAGLAKGEARDRWLDRVAAGDAVLTAAWHEDGGEPDAPGCALTGRDEAPLISGSKVAVPAGWIADAAVVPVTAEDGGVALVLVELDHPSVTRTSLQTTAASRTPAGLHNAGRADRKRQRSLTGLAAGAGRSAPYHRRGGTRPRRSTQG